GDKAADLLFDEIQAQDAFLERPLDVRRFDAACALVPREERRLAREILHRLQHRKHPRPVSRKAHPILNDSLQGPGREGKQRLAAGQRSDARGVMEGRLTIGINRRPHLRLDLEQLAEFGIEEIEQVVQIRPAEHDQLGLYLDGLGAQAAYRKEGYGLEGFNRHAARLEAALEGLPHPRLHDRILEVEYEESAVRFQIGAADDPREIRAAAAQGIDPSLDSAEEISIGGRILADDGSSLGP